MNKNHYLGLLLATSMVASGGLVAGSIQLNGLIPGAALDGGTGQVTFFIYESEDAAQPIASQTFLAGEWQASSKGDGMGYQVQFTALDMDSYEGLWFQATADGINYSERRQIRGGVSDMYVAGVVETGVGVLFPGGLQTAPGITVETDPNLASHTANASAHHTRYTNNEAVNAVWSLDGSGSGLDADLLDGQQASSFAGSSHNHDAAYVNVTGDTMTGPLTATNGTFRDIVSIQDDNGAETIRLEGDETGGGSSSVLEMSLSDGTLIFDLDTTLNEIAINNDSGTETISLDGDSGQAGYVTMRDSTGLRTIVIDAEEAVGDGGQMLMYNVDDLLTVQIDGDSGTKGGYIQLYDGLGNVSITLDGDLGGDGRITTQELAITGGSDLSEQFDIDAATARVEPGMLVSIDPENPGKLVLSDEACDHKVAGIVSGAGGVKPGMMMGQDGSIANGEYPVALTGRVYAMVDASNGAVQPGDLLTTSSIPGYAMKVTDHQRAAGSIIGKAMTPLHEGKGLVLVLVSLQ